MLRSAGLIIVFTASLAVPQKLSYEQYGQQLTTAEEAEKSSKETIAQEQAHIGELRQAVSEVDQKLSQIAEEKPAILGLSREDVSAAESRVESLRRSLSSVESVADSIPPSPAEIARLEAQLAELKAQPAASLWEIKAGVAELESALTQAKAYAAAARTAQAAQNTQTATVAGGGQQQSPGPAPGAVVPMQDVYTVRLIPGRRDCLSRIAEYDFVYGDPAKWPLLYQANKLLIDRDYRRYASRTRRELYSRPEDLILPGQALDIPR